MAPDAMSRQFDENIPLKSFKPTGKVYSCLFVKTILGHKNSPQQPMKVKIARTDSVGLVIGRRTFNHI